MKKIIVLLIGSLMAFRAHALPDFHNGELPSIPVEEIASELHEMASDTTMYQEFVKNSAYRIMNSIIHIKDDAHIALKAVYGLFAGMYHKISPGPEMYPPLERLSQVPEVIEPLIVNTPMPAEQIADLPVASSSLASLVSPVCELNVRSEEASHITLFNAKTFSDASSWMNQTANNFYAKIMVPAYTHLFVPATKVSKNIATEIASAGTDIGKGVASCAQASGKFAYDHPEFTTALVVLTAARAAYVMYGLPAQIVKECRKIDQYITNSVGVLSSISMADINVLENSLLWYAGIYYRVKLGFFIARSYYKEELKIIQDFTQELRRVKALPSPAARDYKCIEYAALQVKMLLTKRLSVSDTALV